MSPRIRIVAGLLAVAALVAAVAVAFHRDGGAASPTSPETLRLEVGGRPLHVPANVVRFVDQRVAGPQPRLDLALTWPELEGRTAANAARFDTTDYAPDVIQVGLQPRRDAVDGAARLATVYSRFFVGEPWTGPGGLQGRRMAPKSGYGDEEIWLEPGAVRPFVARCFPISPGEPPAMCLSDTIHGSLHVTLRFPRALLGEWRELDAGLDARLAAWGVETR
jgi:hypothetical protein